MNQIATKGSTTRIMDVVPCKKSLNRAEQPEDKLGLAITHSLVDSILDLMLHTR